MMIADITDHDLIYFLVVVALVLLIAILIRRF